MIADSFLTLTKKFTQTIAGIGTEQFLKPLDTANLGRQKLVFFWRIGMLTNFLRGKYLKGCLSVILAITENALTQVIFGWERQKITRRIWLKKADLI
jgi:hypothetical protein